MPILFCNHPLLGPIDESYLRLCPLLTACTHCPEIAINSLPGITDLFQDAGKSCLGKL